MSIRALFSTLSREKTGGETGKTDEKIMKNQENPGKSGGGEETVKKWKKQQKNYEKQ